MTTRPTLLKVLLRQRHWQAYNTFCKEYDQAARLVDASLVRTWPSRGQLHRWTSGQLRGLPYPHHCRVMEQMFPGWSADQLFGPCPDNLAAELASARPVVTEANTVPGPPTSELARYPASSEDSLALLADLSSGDLEDRPTIVGAEWSGVTPYVITDYLFGRHNGGLSVAQDVEPTAIADAVRTTAAHLCDLDFTFGGGHVRRTLLFYFRSEVIPQLRTEHPEPVRRAILSAAAEVAQLLGWSAYDAGRHGVAQRYFVGALRLAREAGDHLLGARLLSNLSHQANFLGRFEDAVQYARAAQAEVLGASTPTLTALCLAMEARSLASIGDARECARVLGLAEQSFERRDLSAEPAWLGYFNAEELAGEMAHCFRDLGDADNTREFAARASSPIHTPPRTQAFIDLVTAAGALTSGEPDEAVSIAMRVVEAAGSLQSDRYLRYLTDFHTALTTQVSNAPVRHQFTEQVRERYPTLLARGSG